MINIIENIKRNRFKLNRKERKFIRIERKIKKLSEKKARVLSEISEILYQGENNADEM